MVYKKYIWRNGKKYGPYLYESVRINGKVVNRYVGESKVILHSKNKLNWAVPAIILGILIVLFSGFFSINYLIEKSKITGFSVEDNETEIQNVSGYEFSVEISDAKHNEVQGDVEFVRSDDRGEVVKKASSSDKKTTLEQGKYKVKVTPSKGPLKEIEFNDVQVGENLSDFVRIDDVPETGEFSGYLEVYAIDPSGMNFSEATVVVNAKGSELLKCKEWEFDNRVCNGEWIKLMDIVPGEDYSFVLTPDDPGFAEVNITTNYLLNASDTQFVGYKQVRNTSILSSNSSSSMQLSTVGLYCWPEKWLFVNSTSPQLYNGTWNFSIYAYSESNAVAGYMFARIFKYNGTAEIGSFNSSQSIANIGTIRPPPKLLSWTSTIPFSQTVNVSAGQRLGVQICVNITTAKKKAGVIAWDNPLYPSNIQITIASLFNVYPNVALISPANGNVATSNNINFSCNSTISPGNLKNITFYWNYSGIWTANGTVNINGAFNQTTFQRTNLNNGAVKWNCYACDNESYCAFAPANYSMVVNYTLCVPNITNTSWSPWSNLSCVGSQMNQSRYLVQYDSNNCGSSNQTIYQYQLVGPAYLNTSWSAWTNISCLFGDVMNQTRNLTQYDSYGCAANTTFFEYNETICDYDGAPKIYINSPLNTTYNNRTLLVNISVVDSAIGGIWYNWNGTNISYSGPIYITFAEGLNTVYAWANDTIGNVNSTSVSFTTDTISPSISIVSPQNVTYGNATILVSITASGASNVWFFNGSANEVYTGPVYRTFANGSNSLIAYANDSVGNLNSTSIVFSVDTNIPSIIIESPEARDYPNQTILINITSNGVYTWFFNGTANETYTGPVYRTYPDGNYTIVVYSNNSAGVVNSNYVNFIIDTAAPFIQIDAPLSGIYNYSSLLVAISSLNATNTWWSNGTENFSYFGSAFYTFAEGNNTVYAYANDSAGNLNMTSVVFLVDLTSPYAFIISPQNATITNLTQQNFTLNASDAAGLANATLSIYNQTGLYNQTTINLGGALETTVGVVVNLVSGIYSWFWEVLDIAGNLFTTQTSEGNRTITIDTINPSIVIDSPLNMTYNNATILVDISSTGSYTEFYNGSAWNVYTAPIYLTFAEGSNIISAYTNDSAGNANSTSAIFFVDSVTPQIAINSPQNGTYGNATVLIDITATDLNIDSVWFNNGTANVSYSSPIYASFTNGSHTIIAYANDSAGNVNWTSITFSVDTNIPSIVIESPMPSYYANGTILVNITSNGDATWFFNGTANVSYTGETYINFGEGNHTITAYANNSAGLENSYSVTFTIDTTLPYISIVSPLNTTYTNQTILVNLTASDNNLASIWFNNGTANVTYSSLVYVLFNEGSNTLYAYANDSAGNVNMTSTVFFVYICSPNVTNTSWSSWANLTCAGSQMNQSRYLVQYDSNNCGVFTNQTIYEYQLVGPVYYNTTWGAWYNISVCLANNTRQQARNLTQYDAYSCAANTTFFEYNETICDYDGAPKIYINSPLNATYNNQTVLLNISVVDSAVDRIWFFNGTANVTYSSLVYVLFNEGSNTLYAYANDSAGNVNSTSLVFTVDTSIADSTPPVIVVTEIEPYDPYLGGNVSLSMSATDNVNVSGLFANITLPNGTVVTLALPSIYPIVLIGRHNVTFFANDSSGNIATFEDYFISGGVPIDVQFNIVDYTLSGIPVNLTIYFAGTDKEIHMHDFVGNISDSHTNIIYDLYYYDTLDNNISVRLNGVNLSLHLNNTLGLDRNFAVSGNLVTYGVNSSYGFSSAIIRVSYAGTGYSDENSLILEKCDDWDFTARVCNGTWNDITSQAQQNKTGHYFEVNVTSLSGFGIKQYVAPISSSGGGGGGGRTTPREANIITNTTLIEEKLVQGESRSDSLLVTNLDNRAFNVTLSIDCSNLNVKCVSNLLSLPIRSFALGSGDSKLLEIDFKAGMKAEPGVYAGSLVIDSGFGKKIVNIIVEVRERRPLLDLIIDVSPETKVIQEGGKINSIVNIYNLGMPIEFNVSLTLKIANLDKSVVFELPSESFVMQKNQSLRKIIREINVGNLAPGKYMVLGEARYDGLGAEAYDTFEIQIGLERPAPTPASLLSWIILFWIILLELLILLWLLLRRRKVIHVISRRTRHCRTEYNIEADKKETRGKFGKLKVNFRKGIVGKGEYERQKKAVMRKFGKLDKETEQIKKIKARYTEEERLVLETRRFRLKKEIGKLDAEYKRGTLEKHGYNKTREELLRRVYDLECHYACLVHHHPERKKTLRLNNFKKKGSNFIE